MMENGVVSCVRAKIMFCHWWESPTSTTRARLCEICCVYMYMYMDEPGNRTAG